MLVSLTLASWLIAAQPMAAALPRHPRIIANDHLFGSRQAEIVMVEYADLQCPFCKRHHPNMYQLVKEYDGQVAWVYRHFPLSFHPYAEKAAEASECVHKQARHDAFWKYIDLVYEKQDTLSDTVLRNIAKDMQMNMDKFDRCMEKHQGLKRVNRDYERGFEEGVSGTPTTFLIKRDGTRKEIIGAYPIETLRAEIDALLAS